MLKSDRCLEEQRRLGMEADNMCRWFSRKLCAIQLAIQQAECKWANVSLAPGANDI